MNTQQTMSLSNASPNWEQELSGLFSNQEETNNSDGSFDWDSLIGKIDTLNDLDAFINSNELDVVFA